MCQKAIQSAFIFLLLVGFSSDAVAGRKGKKVAGSEVAQGTLSSGKQVWCSNSSGKVQVGKVKQKKGQLYFTKTTLKAAIKKLKRKRLSKSRFKKKKKRLKQQFAAKTSACQNALGGGGGGSNPGVDPESVSLAPLARAAVAEDFRYLLEKAAFGSGPKDQLVMNIGTAQGLAAGVNELLRLKPEPSGLLARVENRIDEDLEDDRTPTFRGMRQALTDLWINTNNPFYEKFRIALLSIWTVADNVLTSSSQNILLWKYLELLGQTAKNPDMRALAHTVTSHAMMLIFLDGASNLKLAPNENYARELMELFTTGTVNLDGAANYTETPGDIAKLARRLTGWRVVELDNGTGEDEWVPVFSPENHNFATEELFSGTGYACRAESAEDVINCIFDRHPNVAVYYAQELLKWYVTPNPPRKLIENFAALIKQHNFNLLEPLRILFNSRAFYYSGYRDTTVKNSIELAVEFIRTLSIPVNIYYTESQIASMQMAITRAPSVFWWDPSTWTSPPTNIEKANFYARILRDTSAQRGEDPDNPIWEPAFALPVGDEVTARDVVKYVANRMGVALSKSEEDQLVYYMLHEVNGDEEYVPFTYDNRLEYDQRRKGLGVYYILGMHPEFQMK